MILNVIQVARAAGIFAKIMKEPAPPTLFLRLVRLSSYYKTNWVALVAMLSSDIIFRFSTKSHPKQLWRNTPLNFKRQIWGTSVPLTIKE